MLAPMLYILLRASENPQQFFEYFLSEFVWRAALSSSVLVATVALLVVLIAVPLAILVEKTDLPLARLWRSLFVLPLCIPSYVGTFILIATFGPHGSLLQKLLKSWGMQQDLPSIYGFPGAVLGITLFTYPYVFVATQVVLRKMNPHLDEVAMTLGVKRRFLLLKVWLPYIKLPVLASVLLVSLYALSDFGTPSLMRYSNLPQSIYLAYSAYYDRYLAAVLSAVLLFIAFVFLYLERKGRGVFRSYEVISVVSTSSVRLDLGCWRYFAFFWCSIVFIFSFLLPVGVMFYWIVQGGSSLLVDISLVKVIPSLLVALGAAFVITIVIFPFVFFVNRFFPQVYQTYFVLFLAYIVLLGAKSFMILQGGVSQVSSRLEEVARTLGEGGVGVMKRVTFPLMKPAFLSSLVLIFVSVIKELPVTMLLAPIGYQSLATQVWTATEDAAFAEAALLSVIIVGLALFALGLSEYWGIEKSKKGTV
jgi:iron(III) transport system permease protein